MSLRLRLGLAASLVLALALAANVTANASGLSAPRGQERHCIAQAFKVGTPAPAAAAEPRCFPTFAKAIEAATGGAIQLAPNAGTQELRTAQRIRPSAQYVIGIDYWDANFTGSTFTWWVDNPNGCADGSRYWNNVIPPDWQNNISSASTWQGCNHFVHYEGIYLGGSAIDCTCATMGVMNDKSNSEEWYQ